MRVLLLQGGLYALVVALVGGVARACFRPLPKIVILAAAGFPIAFLLPGFKSNRTCLPVADVGILAPWAGTVQAERHTIWLNDAVTQFAPWREAVREAVASGALPLRNRWSGAGQPLAGNSQSAAWAPWRLLALPLPTGAAFNLEAAIKLFLALIGAWLWMRELGASQGGAALGAVLFAFSLGMTAWLLFPHSGVTALWPWSLFAVELSRDDRLAKRATVLLGSVFVLWPLAGQPETAALGAAFVFLWLVARALLGDLPDWSAIARRVLLAGTVALGITAFAWIPDLFAINASSRLTLQQTHFYAKDLSLVPHGPVWDNAIFPTIFPRSFGDHAGPLKAVEAVASYQEMGLGWTGTAALAALGLLVRPGSRRSRAGLASLVLIVLGFGAATGTWPFAEISSVIPGFAHLFSLRYLSWIMPSLAVIAALELTRLERDAGTRRLWKYPLLSAGIVGAMLVFTFVRFRHLWTDPGAFNMRLSALWAAALVLLGFSIVATSVSMGRKNAALILVPIAAAELLWVGQSSYRFLPSAWLFPRTPAIAFLQNQPGHFRVLGSGGALFPNTAVFARVEEIRTHDPVERRDYVEFLNASAGYPPGEYFKMVRDLDSPVMDFLNVRFVVAPPGAAPPGPRWRPAYLERDATIFENPDVLPRAFVPERVTWVNARDCAGPVDDSRRCFLSAAEDIARNRDFRAHAWVSGPWAPPPPRPLAVVDYSESISRVTLRISPDKREEDSLVVASLLQDGGWIARDDEGRRLRTWLANGPFLAIEVPREASVIRLSYAPPGFRTGVIVTFSTVILVAALSWIRRARRVRPPAFP